MKRLSLLVVLTVICGAAAWTAAQQYRMKHRTTGEMINVPGHNGANALLVSGWKTTPAGRQLASGDMILSGAVSPDGKLIYAINDSDGVVYIIESHAGRAVGRVRVGDHPLNGALSKDGKTMYVANLGGSEVAIVDISTPGKPVVADRIPTHPHPNDVV